MKSAEEVASLLEAVDTKPGSTEFPNMSYEQGVQETLEWVLEEIPDEEFVVNFA